MNYIVFDLEFNQFYEEENKRIKPEEKCSFEIIQIGAIKLNEQLQEIGRFNALIRPQIYEKIHPFVEKLTNISMDQISKAETFERVFKDFLLFLGDKNNILVVWGMNDLPVLLQNILYYDLNAGDMPKGYIDIQKYVSKYLKVEQGKNIGLQKAVSLLELEEQEIFHDAFNDAVYTTNIFQKIYSKAITTEIYSYSTKELSKRKKIKRKLDEGALIKQFEKKYGKCLNEREIEMIIRAYKMGASQQFLIPKITDQKNN